MLDLSIKVGFSGPWIAKKKKAKTRKNQGFMRVFCLAGALGLEPRTNGFGDRDSTNWAIPLYAKTLNIIFNVFDLVHLRGLEPRTDRL